jgi:GntR family transcriptional regulator
VEQPKPRQTTAEEMSLFGIQKAALVTHIEIPINR